MKDEEITTKTISALIFFEVGCLIPHHYLSKQDIDQFEGIYLSHGMGLISNKTFSWHLLEASNEILLRTGFIKKRIRLKDGELHRKRLNFCFN